MTLVGVYTVTGKSEYRGHKPGTVFQEFILPGPERRAIARGAIRLERRTHPTLPPDHWLPAGWDTPNHEAPSGASLVEGG